MKTRWFCISAVLISTIFLNACAVSRVSFYVPQVQFLSSLIFNRDTALEDAAWNLYWLGEERPVHAVNVSGHILFANESGDLIQFDGWQVIRSDNLLPGARIATVQTTNTGLRYIENSLIVSQDVCVDWKMNTGNSAEAVKVYTQTCDSEGDSYINEIHLNELDELTKLIFKIHPEYPSLILQLNISPV
ncbi:MAG: hypothetical protein VX605_01710 [Pseudomonadota bacterium]|nr:hypothetical protein [Pseudomonadota bacterium]